MSSETEARVEAGHNATLADANVSEGAKQHSREVTSEKGTDSVDHKENTTIKTPNKKHDAYVEAGHKAALHISNTSEEAREHIHKGLKEMGVVNPEHKEEHIKLSAAEKIEDRVLPGHKAVLTNPSVSDEAKEHIKEVLKEAGVAVD